MHLLFGFLLRRIILKVDVLNVTDCITGLPSQLSDLFELDSEYLIKLLTLKSDHFLSGSR